MAVSTLMAASGKSHFSRHVLNGLFALASPIGAALFYLGASHFAADTPLLGYALAFCAGSFLCIASSDLLPELQFHSHDRFKLSAALLAGLAVAVIIKCTSPGPVFFRQERTGRNERSFSVLKFRTMYEGAEQRKSEILHLNEVDGPLFKVDGTLFPVGGGQASVSVPVGAPRPPTGTGIRRAAGRRPATGP